MSKSLKCSPQDQRERRTRQDLLVKLLTFNRRFGCDREDPIHDTRTLLVFLRRICCTCTKWNTHFLRWTMYLKWYVLLKSCIINSKADPDRSLFLRIDVNPNLNGSPQGQSEGLETARICRVPIKLVRLDVCWRCGANSFQTCLATASLHARADIRKYCHEHLGKFQEKNQLFTLGSSIPIKEESGDQVATQCAPWSWDETDQLWSKTDKLRQ